MNGDERAAGPPNRQEWEEARRQTEEEHQRLREGLATLAPIVREVTSGDDVQLRLLGGLYTLVQHMIELSLTIDTRMTVLEREVFFESKD